MPSNASDSKSPEIVCFFPLLQASFASKQAAVFSSLDRMFTLYGTIVSESMALKSLLFYAAVVTIAYVLTATKRTQNARFWLYCGEYMC